MKTINESQLNNIITESVKKTLKEYFDTRAIGNPGNVKNDKVKALGNKALTNVRGKMWKDENGEPKFNDSDYAVMNKHNGGADKPIAGLWTIFTDAVEGDTDAQFKFFKAMAKNRELKSKISGLLNTIRFDKGRM